MSPENRSKIIPWVVLSGAVLLVAALLSAPGIDPSKPVEQQVVTISRDYVESSLESIIEKKPKLRKKRDQLEEDIKKVAIAESFLLMEAYNQGLALSDQVIRSRLVELQLTALHERADAAITPEAIQKHFSENREQYRVMPERHYLHLFVPATTPENFDQAKQQLEKQFQDDSFQEEPRWVTKDQVRVSWGPDMADHLFKIPLLQWSAPIRSHQGWHRIRALEEKSGQFYELEDVMSRVTEDLRKEMRRRIYDQEIARLNNKYKVEWIN